MRRTRAAVAFVSALAIGAAGLPALLAPAQAAIVNPGPVGNGFTVTPADLAFILKQIKIAERHSSAVLGTDPSIPANPSPLTDPDYCQSMIGTGPNQIPDYLTSYGLRTVDGSCNNLKPTVVTPPALVPGPLNEKFAASDQPFLRLTTPVFKAAEGAPAGFFGPGSPAIPSSSYAQKLAGNLVFDSQPRTISNLIVDQTNTNPAAIAAAGFPVRAQAGAPGIQACTTDPDTSVTPNVVGVPAGCVPSHHTLFIPNVTTDVGLSPPYNSLFTFFGQFFDHGVDQTVKSGGTVFVPLKADDPLITLGPDGKPNTGDEVPPSQAFMVLTRSQNQPGPDGKLGTADDIQNANNTDTPWVDQSQTYTSHASHQVFLREYVDNSAGQPVSTGKLLGGLPAGQTYLNSPDGQTGIGTWAAVKLQAATLLGLKLVDTDVTNIPMLATDPYGKFVPGPLRGLPQYITKDPVTGVQTLVEGDTANPVPVPADVLHFDTPFLTDIAHNADPSPRTDPATGAVTIPTPDADLTPSADFAHQPVNTYDDEMLNSHFICGDGRCNENIALSTIHQVFHSEHDRLVADIKNTLTADTSPSGVAALAQWQLATGAAGWNGERLFQAARFVTEMEYQHLVFEEFARKVQPAVRPFHVYSPDINPAIEAEFAHAVYRFGHSMLDDTVARTNTDQVTGAKSDNSLPLLTAFLNPPEFFNGGTAGTLTPEQAAGSVVMGSSDQVGNELDEFVTETLRNNLLGLPLDLPTLNMVRAREAGVPPLNDVRRQIFGQTNDGQLAPYTSWSDFGQNLKHPESLINFVAAYGTHPSIANATTLVAKRDAARAIVDPRVAAPAVPATATTPAIPAVVGDVPPADAANFMFGTGAWASDASGVTTTGVDNIDLWVGGLAEKTNLFGGLLGSTFNYVFQSQLEKLQDGDRFYYLNRTPGISLRSQLEGNSFSELIMRNTEGTNSLKADAFATADCKFQLANLAGTPAGFAAFGSAVADDPSTTDCNENLLLLRTPDGTIQYQEKNTVNPPGINGQSVYNGTPGVDRITGGNDNDTFWGGAGNDVIKGNGGDDVALGGDGNDIITDLSGADVLKGGPGNDAIDGGIGDDILIGADGSDFINGGANDNETFAGPGNDYVIAGQGADAVFGDGGDDWIEGGSGQDLLQGDHGAPFFDDPAQVKPGNDIMIGQVGENDYDAEGGDDIMAQNAAIDRNAGAAGFDWAIHQYNTVPADDDMNINNNLVGVPIQVVVNRDRWQETEANSGSSFNDVIKGDETAPSTVGGAGFAGCDVLDQAGVDRISGLAPLLPTLTGDPAPVIAASAAGFCPVTGPIWGDGNILLGGPGSDTITGRGANDIIDGDKELKVRISVRTVAADPATEIGSTDLMEHQYLHDAAGNLTGPTLQAAVFAGTVDPGNLVNVREIVSPTAADAASSVDTAVFAGPSSNYAITLDPGTATTLPSITVNQTGANVAGQRISDGIDTLRNIEQLKFGGDLGTEIIQASSITAVAPPVVTVPGAPTIGAATAGAGAATVSFTAPANTGGAPISSFTVVATPVAGAPAGATTVTVPGFPSSPATVNGLTNGTGYTLQVLAVNSAGSGALSAASNAVTPAPVTTVPGAPTAVTAVAGSGAASVSFVPPANTGGAAITGFTVVATPVAGSPAPATTVTVPGVASSPAAVTGLTNGTAYTFQVLAVNSVGPGALSAPSNAVTPVLFVPITAPARPATPTATAANAQATVRWTAPANGGSAITSYTVQAFVGAAATPVRTVNLIPAGSVSTTVTGLTNGTGYTFQVRAVNAVGPGPFSLRSTAVTPATVPNAPAIGVAVAGAPGGAITATARWTPSATTGGAPITGFRISALRLNAAGAVLGTTTVTQTFATPPPIGARTLSVNLPVLGNYRFTVVTLNRVGSSAPSARSNLVAGR